MYRCELRVSVRSGDDAARGTRNTFLPFIPYVGLPIAGLTTDAIDNLHVNFVAWNAVSMEFELDIEWGYSGQEPDDDWTMKDEKGMFGPEWTWRDKPGIFAHAGDITDSDRSNIEVSYPESSANIVGFAFRDNPKADRPR